MQAADRPTAETLLTALRTIKSAERAKHETVLDYWLSIRGDKEFPPLHDLDPLEISDAGPSSILLELIGGGQDAEIRHLGDQLKEDVTVQRIIDAANPSLLSTIAKKLPIVAISRDFLAFEDSFNSGGGWTRCWVTLLPLSSCGSWVDYVYAFVSVETGGGKAAKPAEAVEPEELPPEKKVLPEAEILAEEAELQVPAEEPADEPEMAEDVVPFVAEEPEVVSVVSEPEPEPEREAEPIKAVAAVEEPEPEPEPEEPAGVPAAKSPGFSKLLDGVANLAGFYGQGIRADPVLEVETAASDGPVVEPPLELDEIAPADEPETIEPEAVEQPVKEPAEKLVSQAAPEPEPAMEGSLQSKLSEVRAKADEARQAQLRATTALHEGLSAAYDFAIEAEGSPEDYLRLVEAQGMKIKLRAPMEPVAKLAFEGVCDADTIAEFETVLAWALKQELPRGSLLGRIEKAGGIDGLLTEVSRPS
jgi:hypothetical protein